MSTNKGTLSLGNRTSRKARKPRRGKIQVDMGSISAPSYETHKNIFNPKETENTGQYQKASQKGFFGEEDEYLSQMGWHSDSIVNTFEAATTPEQIAAGRIAAGGASASASFMNNAKLAEKVLVSNINPMMLKHSMIPSEQLAYMAHSSGLNLRKVSSEVKAGISSDFDYTSQHFDTVGVVPKDIEDQVETGFSKSMRQAQIGGINQKQILTPTEQMLTTFGAMTVSRDAGRRQVTAPDSVAFGSEQEFDAKTNQSIIAFERLANLYLPKDLQGFTNLNNSAIMGKTREQIAAGAMRNEIVTALGRQLPQNMSNLSKARSDNPLLKTPTSSALPSIESLGVSKSTANMLVNPLVNKENRLAVNASMAKVKALYNAGNEGGLSRARNTDFFEAKYMADELAASGMDATHTVLSQRAARDQMYDFRVTTDIREAMSQGLQILGMTTEDLKDPVAARKLKRVLLNTTEKFRADETHDEIFKGGKLTMPDKPQNFESIFKTTPISLNPRDHWGNRETSQLSGVPGKEIPKPDMNREADKIYRPGSRGAGSSNQSPAEALANFQKSNPHISGYISDGKDAYGNINEEQHAIWQEARKGKLSSSIAAGMAGERSEDTNKGISNVIKSGLGIKGKEFTGNAMTQSGNILESEGLDWYSKRYDSSTFETGMIENANLPGQSTTPDAMAQGGRRVVEVKSRNDLINRENPVGKQNQALGKYNMQMQHQMYVSGATSGDLVQIRRSAENPNKLFNPGGPDSDNFRRDTFERDEELIGRMSPVWNKVGANASKIAGLDKGDQAALTKAVEEGNIKSFEKLAKKHGLDEEVIGTALGKSPKVPKSKPDLIDTLGSSHGPSSASGMVKAGLARSRVGRGLNVIGAIAGIAYDGANALNDKNLNIAYQARSSGMSEDMWISQTEKLASQGYQSNTMAQQDIKTLGVAAGGLSLGFTEGAEKLVNGTRGLLNFGDIGEYEGDAAGLMKEFKSRARTRFGTGKKADMKMAAMAEASGLNAAVATDLASIERTAMNTGIQDMKANINRLAVSAGDNLGTNIGEIAKGLSWIVGVLGGGKETQKASDVRSAETVKADALASPTSGEVRMPNGQLRQMYTPQHLQEIKAKANKAEMKNKYPQHELDFNKALFQNNTQGSLMPGSSVQLELTDEAKRLVKISEGASPGRANDNDYQKK